MSQFPPINHLLTTLFMSVKCFELLRRKVLPKDKVLLFLSLLLFRDTEPL